MRRCLARGLGCAALAVAVVAPAAFSQDYKRALPADHPAVRYHEAPAADAVARLAARLHAGDARLGGDEGLSRLRGLLEALAIPVDSQMLVFSKTSFQAAHISPSNPRAIYFNDEAAVAWVPGGDRVELLALDPALGPVFYELPLEPVDAPAFRRNAVCLRCHLGPATGGVPGPYVGSVIPGPTGMPLRDSSAIITDHRTPFGDRWGGWYVTARRGEQPDRANAVALNPAQPERLIREAQQNLVSLAGRFDRARYLAPTSDIVALMTFEHQTQMTNLLTRVAWLARMAAHEGTVDPAAGELGAEIDETVAYMLFGGEAPLVEPIEGVSTFTETFPARGPRDAKGRSLRDFDLHTRLFRYPLSYMIYSPLFDGLPAPVRGRILERLRGILTGGVPLPEGVSLTAADRRAIVEILRETKPDLPAAWRADP